MTLATHRTQAPAARKRGGGLAHMPQDCAVATGRQQMPEGGEINSLCRAAAGIIPTLSTACAAVVYPTAGVRRAASLDATLRSISRPHAQPVVGYTHPSATNPELRKNLFGSHVCPKLSTVMINQDCDGKQQLPLSKRAQGLPVLQHGSKNGHASSGQIGRYRHRGIRHEVAQNLSQHFPLCIHVHIAASQANNEFGTVAPGGQP